MKRLASAVLALGLVIAGCGPSEDDDPSTVEAAPGVTTTSFVASSTAPPGETTSTTTPADEIRIGYAGGKVTGGGRKDVAKGSTVRLVITADVTDEIHVHGYDLTAAVTPSTPATLTFTATLSGSWEVELHKARKELAQLRVSS